MRFKVSQVSNFLNIYRERHARTVLFCAFGAVGLFYGACNLSSKNAQSFDDVTLKQAQLGSSLESKLEEKFETRYSGWMFGLPQQGTDNILALKKVPYSDELFYAFAKNLVKTLPALRAHLAESEKPGIPQESSDRVDKQGAFEELERKVLELSNSEDETFAVEPVSQDLVSISSKEAIASLELLDAAEQAQSILEYLANVPQNSDARREMRALIILLLGQSELSNEFTLQGLNLMARGVNLSLKDGVYASYETQLANGAIQQIVERRKQNYIAPFQAVDHRLGEGVQSFSAQLKDAKIVKIKPLGQNKGVNDSVIVTMKYAAGGQDKYLFKSALGTPSFSERYYENNPNDFLNFINYTREARAANFFHFILDEMTTEDKKYEKISVPYTFEVALYFEGKSFGMGSLQKFLDSDYVDIVEHQNNNRESWNREIFSSQTWRDAAVIVKVLDFTFGNIDRLLVPGVKDDFDKNLMVRFSGNPMVMTGLALIDNGLGLPGRDWYTVDKLVSADHMPAALKNAFRKKESDLDELLTGEMYHFVDWGLRDFGARYQQVVDRIGR